MLGEVGEICNKVKKVIRDNNNEVDEDIAISLLAEAGDVIWYASRIYEELESESTFMYKDLNEFQDHAQDLIQNGFDDYKDFYNVVRLLGASACKIDETLRSANILKIRSIGEDLDILMIDIGAFAIHLSSDLESIAECNIKKLQKRLEDNKIKGNGDDR